MASYYSSGRFLFRVICAGLGGWEVRGVEQVPRTGGLIIAANHTSYWDPPIVGAALPRDVYFLAKQELFANPVFGAILRRVHSIPIRRGAVDMSGLTRASATVHSGGALVLFPEGSRMRDGELHPARPGVGLLAAQADVPIVPCYISGSNRPARWITRRSRLRVRFGAAMDWRELAGPDSDLSPGRMLYQRVGEAVMRQIAALRSMD